MSRFRSRARSYVLDACNVLIQLSENIEATYRRLEKLLREGGSPLLVELNGIEPSTSGLQSPRSPS